MICQWFNNTHAALNPRNVQDLQILLSGAAGTGKTFLVEKVIERIGSHRVKCVSFQGIAASLLPNGQTIHTAFALSVKGPGSSANSSRYIEARRAFDGVVLLVIDEISNTASNLFLAMDRRLKEWRGNNLPFGGLGVIAMGDMFQLPPVAGLALTHASLIKGNPAGSLFARFKLVTLSKQMRADDQEHAKQLEYFRNPSHSMKPVLHSKILSSLKPISSADYESDPLWFDATIIVSENATRITLNRSQAMLFARKHNQPVISWRMTLTEDSRSIFTEACRGDLKRLDDIMDAIPELTFYFVKGAPAVMKDNLWTSEGLVNGRMCKLHSLTLDGPTAAMSWERINKAGPGEEVMLPVTPLSVNVTIEKVSPRLAALSIEEGIVVLPLMQQLDNPRKLTTGKKQVRYPGKGQSKVCLSYFDYGIDLAFAVTYHKVQGRTLNRVIIDFSSVNNVSVAGFYVAVSRTTCQDHIRILPCSDVIMRRQLEEKEFDSELVEWLARKTNDAELLRRLGVSVVDELICSKRILENDSDSDTDDAGFASQRPRVKDSSIVADDNEEHAGVVYQNAIFD